MASQNITPKRHPVWNSLDDWGLAFGIERLPSEGNEEFRQRLLSVAKANGNASLQGVVDGLSASLGLDSWNTSGEKHFYLRFKPLERDDDNNPLTITVLIDNVGQTQLIEFLTPLDWMVGGVGNYVYTANDGFIVWRDDEGHYTRHLEFLKAPETGAEIKVTYSTKTDSGEIIQIVETESENRSLKAKGVDTPADNQIKVEMLYDPSFQAQHLDSDGMTGESLMNYVDEINSPYPFQWDSFEWDTFRWEVGRSVDGIPSYFDSVSASGDLASGTGHDKDLHVTGVDDLSQPLITPGFVYYRDREYYLYNALMVQDVPGGAGGVVISGAIDSDNSVSGSYELVDPAPIVCTGTTSLGLIIGGPEQFVVGGGDTFTGTGQSVFTLSSTPAYPSLIQAWRIISKGNAGFDYTIPESVTYNSSNNTVTINPALASNESLVVSFATYGTRYSLNDVLDKSWGGYNLAMNYRYGHRSPTNTLTTIDTLDETSGIPISGEHHHNLALSNSKLQDGRLRQTILVNSGEYAHSFNYSNESWDPDPVTNYMALGGFDHEHTVVSGNINYATVTLPGGTKLKHTHTLTISGDYGWYEPTPNKLRRRSDLTTISLNTPASQVRLNHIWDQATTIPGTEGGYFTTYPSPSGMYIAFDAPLTKGTLQYEGAREIKPVPIPPPHCPPIDENSAGKILAIGGSLAAVKVNLYPSTTAIAQQVSAEFGITVQTLDRERGGVPQATVAITSPVNAFGHYWDITHVDPTQPSQTDTSGLLHKRLLLTTQNDTSKGEEIDLKVTVQSSTPYRIQPTPNGVYEVDSTYVEEEDIIYYTYEVTKTLSIRYVGE